MSTSVSSPLAISSKKYRPATPIRRRSLAPLQLNSNISPSIERALLDLITLLKDSSDSSTQLLIRLYHHKSIRLSENPRQLSSFQQEIFSALRRLHPTVVSPRPSIDQENQLITPNPIVICRSAQATIRKLH